MRFIMEAATIATLFMVLSTQSLPMATRTLVQVDAFAPSCVKVHSQQPTASTILTASQPSKLIRLPKRHNRDEFMSFRSTSMWYKNGDNDDDNHGTTTTLLEPDQLPKITDDDSDPSSPSSTSQSLPNIATMKTRDMKQELESYGVSTRSLFDRSDYEHALIEARKVKVSKSQASATSKSSSTRTRSQAVTERTSTRGKDNNSHINETRTTSIDDDSANNTWQGLYNAAVNAARTMSVSKLKDELKRRGVSTKALFDKDEFVKAYGTAVADKVPIKTIKDFFHTNKSDNDSNDSKNQRRQGKDFWDNFHWNSNSNESNKKKSVKEEQYDPSYRDVTTYRFNPKVELAGDTIIDIRLAS